MRHLSSVMEIAGLALITAGAAVLSPIAGLIVGGATLVLLGYALDRSPE